MTTDKPKGKPGRKTRLTPERQQKIVNAIRAGAYVETAAAAAGINKVTRHATAGRVAGRVRAIRYPRHSWQKAT